MKSLPSFLLAAGLAVAALAPLRAEETTTSVKFSDPAKPGTVRINLGRNELRVDGADATDVTVRSDAKAAPKRRSDGMRALTAATSLALSEKDNVIFIDAASDGGHGGSTVRLNVPRKTSIIVQNAFGGSIACTRLDGDIEIASLNGGVRLDDVAGSVVVSTQNGEIQANVRELHDGKPLSFQSMNGQVVVSVPAATKANVRFRTQNGEVLTDFDETALITKTESVSASPRKFRTFTPAGGADGVLPPEAREAIRDATRLGMQAAKEAVDAVKEGLDAARQEVERARADTKSDMREAEIKKAEQKLAIAAAEVKRAQVETVERANADRAMTLSRGDVWAKLSGNAVPTISGGKLLTGTLNGGGPEISISTMNGDLTLRQLEKK